MRHYLEALDARGRILRVPEVDQDAYEATAFMYQLLDNVGWGEAPVVIFERVKMNGVWMEHPVIGNQFGRWEYEPLAFGVETDASEQRDQYRATLAHLEKLTSDDGQWKSIEPVEVDNDGAACKEVKLFGDDIDILKFPFLKTNPADGGAYINAGNVVLEDPKLGRNVGTYRCQIKGPKKLGINPEKNQHGWTFLMDMKERGEPFAKAAVILGADPIVFAMGSSKTARLGQDELQVAGGFLGEPVEVVKCETNDLRVPANVEMVIEGEIPFDFEPEGPFGEMYGYIGERKSENFYMNVTAVTHRKNPIFANNFTGIQRGFLTAPFEVTANRAYREKFPNLRGIHFPLQTPGFCFISIKKESPGEAIKIGREITTTLKIAKIAIVVDHDVDIHKVSDVMHAIGSRWQPNDATEIIEKAGAMGGDPSATTRGSGSRIVVDATRQWPEEGGPAEYAKMNRECLTDAVPDIFEKVDEKFGDLIRDWKRS
jgi:UbiD family decarboxylase